MSEPARDAPIRIVPVDADNWEEAARLEVLPEQSGFLTPNVFSIAESKFHPELQPRAIYAGDTMIGFAMFARHPDDGDIWIFRFMIDRRYQRRGFGRRALRRLIDIIRIELNATEINIGYDDDNHAARALYRDAGFVEGGIAAWGERTARFTITPPSSR